MTPQEVERELGVDVAVRWGTGYDTELRSFVNVIATPKGGTHVSGFEQALTKTFNDVMRADQGAQGQRRRRDQGRRARGPDRGRHGAAGRAAVRGPDQGDPRHARGRAASYARWSPRELKKFLTSTKRAEKAQAKLVMEKVVARLQDPDRRPPAPRDPAPQERPRVLGAAGQARRLPGHRQRAHRAVHRRGRLGARHRQARPQLGVPGAAADPRQDPQRPEGLGRRHAQERRVRLDHPGGRRRLRAAPSTSRRARYGRIIFMADADSDGAHIRCLLATLFFKYMPDLIDRGPGLHRRPAAAPDRADQPQEGDGQVRLHLLRRRAAAEAGRAGQEGRALEGPGPALQGPRRDGRRPAGRDHDGPAPPHPAPDHRRRRRVGRARSSSC